MNWKLAAKYWWRQFRSMCAQANMLNERLTMPQSWSADSAVTYRFEWSG